ncbi:RNA recognition motif domain-containing protein [Pseudomonas sp. gcc21]|uniref:RNA recognition motif domain-containing protein n=1 Tax=Pseudomonas sp. gcc21 TaxID=2726989 RepID=UPI003556AB9D
MMKLLVRNLARNTTEAELRNLFEAHGIVTACDLVLDQQTGKSKGFGFVEMPHPSDAKAAIKRLNGTDVAGSRIRVKLDESTSA